LTFWRVRMRWDGSYRLQCLGEQTPADQTATSQHIRCAIVPSATSRIRATRTGELCPSIREEVRVSSARLRTADALPLTHGGKGFQPVPSTTILLEGEILESSCWSIDVCAGGAIQSDDGELEVVIKTRFSPRKAAVVLWAQIAQLYLHKSRVWTM